MKVAVVGAGPAGVVAAHRLRLAGHEVTVFEALSHVGGRTHAERFGPGHHLDTGAGWFTSAYTRTLRLLEEIGEQDRLVPLRASAPAELIVAGERYAGAVEPRSGGGDALIPPDQQHALGAWLRGLADHPKDLSVELSYDDEDAMEHLSRVSPAAAEYLFAPMFEGLFAPIAEQSAAMLRSWTAAGAASYWQVEGGTDSPFISIAGSLDVRTSTPVREIALSGDGVEIVTDATVAGFDAAVVAVPPPVGNGLLTDDAVPPWYAHVTYFGQCRLYAARPVTSARRVHVRPLPMGLITSVETQDGANGAWGACPEGWEWALVCANGAFNDELLPMDDGALAARLWDAARDHAELFDLAEAEVTHLVRWTHAVPTMPPGHFRRLAGYDRRPPIVLAGDWTHQACVEGAVRSGEAAAAAIGADRG